MATTKTPRELLGGEMLFSMESVDAMQDFRKQAGMTLKELARDRAIQQGRQLVSAEDVYASVAAALRAMLAAVEPPNAAR